MPIYFIVRPHEMTYQKFDKVYVFQIKLLSSTKTIKTGYFMLKVNY